MTAAAPTTARPAFAVGIGGAGRSVARRVWGIVLAVNGTPHNGDVEAERRVSEAIRSADQRREGAAVRYLSRLH